MSQIDGGPAFPQHVLNPTPETYAIASNNGMSLRDYFAGQALAGFALAACIDTHKVIEPGSGAKTAYEFADAWLAERSKTHVD